MIVSVHLLLEEQEVARGRSWTGSVPADSCVRVGRLDLLVPAATGELAVELVLRPADPDHPPVTPAFGPDVQFPLRRRTTIAVG